MARQQKSNINKKFFEKIPEEKDLNLTYQQYRSHIQQLAYLKKQLIELEEDAKNIHTIYRRNYNKYCKLDFAKYNEYKEKARNIRKLLIKKIPSEW